MKTVIRITALTMVAIAALLVLRSASRKNNTCSKESIEDCCKKKAEVPGDNNILFESLTKQFISLNN
jgi:hypothetical protein